MSILNGVWEGPDGRQREEATYKPTNEVPFDEAGDIRNTRNTLRNRNANKPRKLNQKYNDKKQHSINIYKDSEGNAYNFPKSSYLPKEMKTQTTDRNLSEGDKEDAEAIAINSFCDDFLSNFENFKELQEVIIDELPVAIGPMTGYYSINNNKRRLNAMNRLLKITCTTNFAKMFKKVIDSKVWLDDGSYNKCWRGIVFTLSLALEAFHERMHEDTQRIYATQILPKLWAPEINEISTEASVTKDLTLDLLIAIPMLAEDNNWTQPIISEFYYRFLDKMIIHADDNIGVLNHEIQGKIFRKFFGKSKTALKVIGKYMVTPPDVREMNPAQSAVYEEFIKMLYVKLDKYDIDRIVYVLKYIAEQVKDHELKSYLFDMEYAKQFENIRKALKEFVETPETAELATVLVDSKISNKVDATEVE